MSADWGAPRTWNFGLCGHAESKKTQKFVFRSALRPNQMRGSELLLRKKHCSFRC
jgi:hypothetical protein